MKFMSEITFDGQRVIETAEDGSTTQRPASLCEQLEHSLADLVNLVVRTVPHATSGSGVLECNDAAGSAVLTITLQGVAGPLDPPEPAPEPEAQQSTPTRPPRGHEVAGVVVGHDKPKRKRHRSAT